MHHIVRRKNREIIEWLLEQGYTWEEGSGSSAIVTGDLDFVKWVS